MLLTTAGLIASGGSSLYSLIEGERISRSAENELDKFQYQELTNLAESLKPSFEAERQLRLGTSQMLGTTVDVAQGRDIAGALGLLSTGFTSAQETEMKGLTSMLDKQYQADLARVQEEQNIRQIQETRDLEKLTSLRAQAQAGAQMKSDALGDLAMTMVSAGVAQEAALAEAGIDPRSGKAFQQIKDVVDTADKAVSTVDTAKSLSDAGKLQKNQFDEGLEKTYASLQPSSSMRLDAFRYGTMPEFKNTVFSPEYSFNTRLDALSASGRNFNLLGDDQYFSDISNSFFANTNIGGYYDRLGQLGGFGGFMKKRGF